MWRKKDRIDILKFLFPRYLVLLAILPLVTGFIIDHELVHPISFLVALLWMLPFTLPYYIFRRPFIYSIAAIYYFLVGFLEIGHWLVLDGPLTISSLLNFFNSNYNEVTAYIDLKFNNRLWFLLPYTLLFIVTILNPPMIRWYRLRFSIVSFIVVLFNF
ncbi:MAG: hypothetical protein KJN76_11620, partial [Eudoraea sp.]|nr:hypothetical protein [Eudoraea sp.]